MDFIILNTKEKTKPTVRKTKEKSNRGFARPTAGETQLWVSVAGQIQAGRGVDRGDLESKSFSVESHRHQRGSGQPGPWGGSLENGNLHRESQLSSFFLLLLSLLSLFFLL